MGQNLNALENPSLLPFSYVKNFQDLDGNTSFPQKRFLLSRTAAVLHINGLLNLSSLITVETEHAPFQRLSGVISPLSLKAREFMQNNHQFVDFYDGIACLQIIDERIINEIQHLATI